MDEVERIRAVRRQRRETVAAIEAVEAWARTNRAPGSTTYTDALGLYLRSQEADTVEELAGIEAEAHASLRRLQGGPAEE